MKTLFNIKNLKREDKAGLYLTISLHLVVLIILLASSISQVVKQETSFVLDFTKQEELERQEEIAAMKESVSKELDALIAQAKANASGRSVRNVAVNAGAKLKDDRNANPAEVYDDARRLQDKLDASRRDAQKALDSEDDVAVNRSNDISEKREVYSGPSVLSWRLDGRDAINLEIPAYKCKGGGDVAVAIVVNRNGYVIAAKVIDNTSSSDICLRDYAVKAAKKSRFSRVAQKEPEKQAGEILYRFIAQ